MVKRRPLLVENTKLDELFPDERRRGKRKKTPSPSQAQFPHATYRLIPGQHEELKMVAAGAGVELNELVRCIFADFLKRYKNDEVVLPRQVETKEIEVVRLVH